MKNQLLHFFAKILTVAHEREPVTENGEEDESVAVPALAALTTLTQAFLAYQLRANQSPAHQVCHLSLVD